MMILFNNDTAFGNVVVVVVFQLLLACSAWESLSPTLACCCGKWLACFVVEWSSLNLAATPRGPVIGPWRQSAVGDFPGSRPLRTTRRD